MPAVGGGRHERLLAQAQEIVLAQKPQHPLVVDLPALAPQERPEPAVAIVPVRQGQMLQAISQTDTVPVVRVAWNEPAAIMKALDLGAYGIIVPLVNTAAEAAMAVAACRYPPVGMRSNGPVRAVHYGGGDYVANANGEIVVMAMIETKEGLANLDAICATPGLDAVYIGPADLSFALGLAPRGDNPDPLHIATCDKILAAAHKAGIKCVMHCASAAFAAGAVKRGFDMVMLTSDLSCMIAGARMQLDELKAKTA